MTAYPRAEAAGVRKAPQDALLSLGVIKFPNENNEQSAGALLITGIHCKVVRKVSQEGGI
jgi:hypothetical protein